MALQVETTRARVQTFRMRWNLQVRKLMYGLVLLIAVIVVVVYLSGDPDD